MSATLPVSSTLVIDASVAVWSVLPVLAGAGIDANIKFTGWQQANLRLVAPMLWLAECTSAIRLAVYARIISTDKGRIAISDLSNLEVELSPLDEPLCLAAFEWAGRLGQSRAYNAFYLALADLLKTEFWTADKRLANGAQQIGATWVHWVGES